jgi:hypothetical protein
MNTFTPEELIQYMYKETSTEKTAAIKAALQNDWQLREYYENLAATKKQLDDVRLSPREDTIKKILDYAEKSISLLHPH